MSRRIAHRPRYRSMQQLVQPTHRFRQYFFRTRWSYHRLAPDYEKHALGHGVSRIPLHYRLAQHIIVHQAALL